MSIILKLTRPDGVTLYINVDQIETWDRDIITDDAGKPLTLVMVGGTGHRVKETPEEIEATMRAARP